MSTNFTPTKQQVALLVLLYRFRFLTSIQLQVVLGHKYHSRIIAWLNELYEQGFIKRYYAKGFRTEPAIYSLDKLARTYFKNNEIEGIKLELLRRIYYEDEYSEEFRKHCLFLGDIAISLIKLTQSTKAKLHFYTKVDLEGVEHLMSPLSDAYLAIDEARGITKRYFLDAFDESLPPKAMRQRVRQYIRYYNSSKWQNNTTDKPFPEIILIAPNERMKSHLFYYIRRKLNDELEIQFYLASYPVVVKEGLSKKTLQKIYQQTN